MNENLEQIFETINNILVCIGENKVSIKLDFDYMDSKCQNIKLITESKINPLPSIQKPNNYPKQSSEINTCSLMEKSNECPEPPIYISDEILEVIPDSSQRPDSSQSKAEHQRDESCFVNHLFSNCDMLQTQINGLVDLTDFIVNGKLNIDETNWSRLKKEYSQEVLSRSLSLAITNLEYPYKEYHPIDVENDFWSLTQLDPKDQIKQGILQTKFDYKLPLTSTYIDAYTTGSISSDYFQQKNRCSARSDDFPSPVDVWKIENYRRSIWKGLWLLNVSKVDSTILRNMINYRKYVATQFKPSVAKTVYHALNSRKILDFCSGWGDRLCGFYAHPLTEEYVGVDPNERLMPAYLQQQEFYSKVSNTSKKVVMISQPFEDLSVEIYKDYFDTVFTSPPYYDLERYSEDPTQSWVRYKNLDTWLNQFLFACIDKAGYCLRSKGFLAINISDFKKSKKRCAIVDRMNEHIKNHLNFEYMGVIGIKLPSRRPSSRQIEDPNKIMVDPIWIWQKP